jgi:hypothetical protein
VILLASQTVTASGSGATDKGGQSVASVGLHGGVTAAEVLLTVTAAATAVGDTLNVYVQAAIDNASWDDIISFTQVLGNGGAKKFLARWQGQITPTTAMAAPAAATLAAGSVAQGPHGLVWRVQWVVVSASSPSFTFSVMLTPFTGRA